MVSRTSIGPKEAAELVGRSKSAILKAIREGRISAIKSENGEWHIEPVELFRVYPERVPSSAKSPETSSPKVSSVPHPMSSVEIDHLRDLLRRAEQREADLIEERNAWREQAQRLALTDQRQPAVPEDISEPTARRSIWPWRRN